ncbi:sortase [Corynebacterium phocae]|uniref:Sortase n=1 Tax=Corynebacterium phocae TaxID=161895 RepID=A0A1L7D6Q8_9CORY|nr:sortase [Corynebacterium phocae]KAA8726540.1 class C sortase [Corynebacterium phocae]
MGSKPQPRHARKKKRGRSGVVYILLGILVLLFPIFATLYNDYQLDKTARQYAQKVKEIEPGERVQHYIDEAHAYNQRLAQSGHHAMKPDQSSPGFDEYMDTLNPPETSGMIARIVIPSLDIDLPVYHTTAPSVLYRGAGHMFGSDLPVGGEGTNAVISAHTGMVNASMFDNLPRVKDGAEIYIEVMGQTLAYEVTSRQVVKPDKYDAVTYESDQDKITLITCTPYGINTDRLLVTAHRIHKDDIQIEETWKPTFSWWMVLALVLIFLVLLIVVIREWRRKRRRRAAKALASADANPGNGRESDSC